jgi:TP901 family phage tail tape measure protein
MAAIDISVKGNTKQLERDIQSTVNKAYTINLKTKGDAPLGRITGKVNEFNKSLDASNARVIAFGATTGIIFGVQKAFRALVDTTIDVQKQLKDINVLLNLSNQSLNQFGSRLFNIAKNTGQSFSEVASAAQELARQGLGVEQTLERVNEALILSRLSGLSAAKSVEALTAALNSYASQAVTASEIVNKFANVDASFAVSSRDLADAIGRVGSSAAQAGVSLDELIAIVTTAQQTTARGGSVIGNSFKTIFTRLQRGKVLEILEGVGVETKDAQGGIKSTIQLLQDLARVYDNLDSVTQSQVAEQVGGVFQINVLKASLADLGREYSIYDNALRISSNSTDEAIRRNEELNKTYAAQLNALQENIKQFGTGIGESLIGPSFDRIVGNLNEVFNKVGDSDGKGFGATFAKGILDGIGQVIAGPGLILIGGILIKLFKDVGTFATGSVQTLLGLNQSTQEQAELQRSVQEILSSNPRLLDLMKQGTAGVNAASVTLLNTLKAQSLELEKQSIFAKQVASVLYSGGIRVSPTGLPTVKGKAQGYIPNFATQKEKIVETMGAYQAGYEPGKIRKKRLYDGQGGSFLATVNDAESFDELIGLNGKRGTLVTPPTGFAAKGFIPNFAKTKKTKGPSKREIQKRITEEVGADQYKYLVPSITEDGGRGLDGIIPGGPRAGFQFPEQRAYAPKLKQSKSSTKSFEERIYNQAVLNASNYTSKLNPPGFKATKEKIEKNFEVIPGAKGALQSAIGSTFEVAIVSALDYESAKRSEGGDFDVRLGAGVKNVQELFGTGPFKAADFKSSTSRGNIKSFRDKIIKELSLTAGSDFGEEEQLENAREEATQKLKGKYPLLFAGRGRARTGLATAEVAAARQNFSRDLEAETQRIFNQKYGGTANRTSFASGYIPNFASIMDAVDREKSAGIPESQIYIAQENALKSANPMGLGVFNRRNEPTAAKRREEMGRKGFAAKGYIPNFAPTEAVPAAGLSESIVAVVAQLGILAFSLRDIKTTYDANKQAIITNTQNEAIRNQARLSELQLEKQKNALTARQNAELLKLEAAIKKNQAALNQGIGGFGKFTAALQASSFALSIGGPILGETIKNLIGTESKGARQGSAIASGLGQAAALAGTGALIAGPFAPLGAAIGGTVGLLLTVNGYLKESATNLPELAAASKKASEELTQFNERTQKVLKAFEQIKELREGGQAEKAGKLESQTLRDIAVDFVDQPDLRIEATAALLNKDFERLRNAVEANTEAITKEKEEADLKEQLVRNTEALRESSRPFFAGTYSVEDLDQAGKDAVEALSKNLFRNIDTDQKTSSQDIEKLNKAIELFSSIVETTGGGQGFEGESLTYTDTKGRNPFGARVEEALGEIGEIPGLTEETLKELRANNLSYRAIAAVLEETKNKVTNWNKDIDAIARQTSELDPIVRIVQNALENISKNFTKAADLSAQTLALQSAFNVLRQQALDAIKVEDLSGRAEIASTFGGQELSRSLGIEADIAKIDADFNKDIGSALQSVSSSIEQTLSQAISSSFENIRSFGGGAPEASDQARSQLEEAFRLSGAVFSESIKEQVKGLIDEDSFRGGEIFDVQGIIDQLQENADISRLPGEEQKKALDKIKEELNKANVKLQESKVLQEQQLIILANQKLNELIKELATAVIGSFGGIEKFITGKALDDTVADDIKKFIAERAGLRATEGTPSRETETEIGRRAGRLLDAFTDVLGGRGGIFTEDTGLVQEEIRGQANNIEDIFKEIEKAATAQNASAAEVEAFEKTRSALIEQAGFKEKDFQPGTDLRPVFEEIAKIQSLERRKTGEISAGIRESAFERLKVVSPELAKRFDAQGNISGGSLDATDLSLGIQSEQVQLLTQIRDILNESERDIAETDILSSALESGISLPNIAGVVEAINNLPVSLTDVNNLLEDPGSILDQPINLFDPRKAGIGFDGIQRGAGGWTVNPYEDMSLPRKDLTVPNYYPGDYSKPLTTADAQLPSTYFDEIQNRYNPPESQFMSIDPSSDSYEELSDIRSSAEEASQSLTEFGSTIDTFIDRLNEININNVNPSANITPTIPEFAYQDSSQPINIPVEINIQGSQSNEEAYSELKPFIEDLLEANLPNKIREIEARTNFNQEAIGNLLANQPSLRPPPRPR